MSPSNQNAPAVEPAQDQRMAYVAGLREFADFLESTPDVEVPTTQRTLLLSLSTNSAVEEFAAKHGLTVAFDGEGNASADMTFGPVVYHAYGYVDFAEHCDRNAERTARTWADRHGLEIVKPIVSDDTIRQAENLLQQNIADREAAKTTCGQRGSRRGGGPYDLVCVKAPGHVEAGDPWHDMVPAERDGGAA